MPFSYSLSSFGFSLPFRFDLRFPAFSFPFLLCSLSWLWCACVQAPFLAQHIIIFSYQSLECRLKANRALRFRFSPKPSRLHFIFQSPIVKAAIGSCCFFRLCSRCAANEISIGIVDGFESFRNHEIYLCSCLLASYNMNNDTEKWRKICNSVKRHSDHRNWDIVVMQRQNYLTTYTTIDIPGSHECIPFTYFSAQNQYFSFGRRVCLSIGPQIVQRHGIIATRLSK